MKKIPKMPMMGKKMAAEVESKTQMKGKMPAAFKATAKPKMPPAFKPMAKPKGRRERG